MIFMPCSGFLLQAYKMRTSNSTKGFSTLVSFLLILSNLIRLFWWICEPFQMTLFYAAFAMVLTQFVVLYNFVKVTNKNKSLKFVESFWTYSEFGKYTDFVIIIVYILGFSTFMLKDEKWFAHSC